MLLRAFLLSLFVLLFVSYGVSDAQTTGQTRNNSNTFQVFDGTVFDTPDYGSLGGCSVSGQMQYSGGTMRFCNGSTWRNLDSGVNNGGCSTAGQIRRNTTWLEFCNGTNWRKINPTHIDGACLNEGASNNLCNDGTANDAAIADTSAQWRWRCDGLYGGSNSGTCYKNKPINGVCTNEGASNNLCSAGIANDGAISDTSAQWRWRCDGQYGGSNSGTCYKNKPVNGVCNNATRNACSAGTSNDGAIADTSVYWRWRCDGQYGGSNSGTCQKNKPVNGVCNNATRNACSAGTSNDGAIADTTAQWRWRCDGQYGGSNSGTCAKNKASCSATTISNCSLGAIASGSSTGSCAGGYSGSCSYLCNNGAWSANSNSCALTPVNGVCNNATRNACSAGTPNDGAIADTTAQWRWRCDGQNGGSNSGTCAKNKASCSATTISNCSLGATASGGSTGSCASGYTGSCNYTCNNGTWSSNSNSCAFGGGGTCTGPTGGTMFNNSCGNYSGYACDHICCGGTVYTMNCGAAHTFDGICGNDCSSLPPPSCKTTDCVAGAGVPGCNVGTVSNAYNPNTEGMNCTWKCNYAGSSVSCSSTIPAGGCFAAGTYVSMSDGSFKAIEEINIGESVKGMDGAHNVVEEVLIHNFEENTLYAFNGGAFFVTAEHPFMTEEGWKAIDPELTINRNADFVEQYGKPNVLKVGDVLIKENGKKMLIETIESRDRYPTKMPVYNLRVNGNSTYYADGYLVHNK